MGLVFHLLGDVQYYLVDDLGEEDADTPEENGGKVGS